MSELLITFNASASKKNGFVVLDTYYTKSVRTNKAGKYRGGSISNANALECVAVDNVDCSMVRKCFSKLCFQLSYKSFFISLDNLIELHGLFREKALFFIDNTDKSLILIKSIARHLTPNKAKYRYSIGANTFSFHGNGSLLIDADTDVASFVVKQLEPTPKLYFDQETKAYSLLFDYHNSKAQYLDGNLSLHQNDAIYLRNFQFETVIAKRLLEAHFTKLSQGRFAYSGSLKQDELSAILAQNGIGREVDESVTIPRIRVHRTNSGWFEIDLEYDIDGEVSNLASQINLFANKGSLDIKGHKVVLPTSITEAGRDLVLSGNKLKIHPKNMFSLLRIIHDSGRRVSDFFSYSETEIRLPQSIIETAYPYQLEGIKWLKFLFVNHIGGCLADDMGLGKTFQVISFLEEEEIKRKIKKVLIVVPKSLLTNWAREFEKFHSKRNVAIYHGEKRQTFDFQKFDVIITTYNTAYLDEGKLKDIEFSLAIFDEIQMVKNHKSITSDAMKRLNAEVKFGLSGTPMENSLSELWNVMDMLNPGVFHDHTSFANRYNVRNRDELRTILDLFIMRRTKQGVLVELPPKIEQLVYCDMDSAQRKLYTSLNVAVKTAIMNLKAFAAPVVLKGLSLLRECCCHPLLLGKETNVDNVSESCKLDSLKILVNNLFESGHKMLIFSNYASMLQIIKKELEKYDSYKNNIYYLDGKTNNRSEVVQEFEDATAGIFLISIKAGGVGLNLVSAQDVIIYDPWWNPFVEQQAIDRAYRIGQKQSVTVYRLIVANSLEERIMDMQNAKKQDFDNLINGLSVEKNLDLETIIGLL